MQDWAWVYLTNLLTAIGFAKSKSEVRRLLAQGAIEVDGKQTYEDTAEVHEGSIIKVGKRRFLQLVDPE